MHHVLTMLKNRFLLHRSFGQLKQLAAKSPQELRVLVPDAVVLPLPRTAREEISVPASINGRDLSTGRL
ncbi:hypothetical protein F4695_001902 [Rhizobium soli]|uniref:Transposase n=1 Tax=Rhizobium soli TaxID=424798 RepID=A0A7X0JJ87_9HYPH|nr:hypothetical protein [Rhizobium soli]MBB6508553.1 hypothetical protein [Rhizobium soli]